MQRYLLFDGGCAFCTKLAQNIEREADGWVRARSLHDADMQALLSRARPGWTWEPTLLEVEGERVRAYAGFALRVRLVLGLGIKRALRIANQVQQSKYFPAAINEGRRSFLRQSTLLAGLLFFGPHSWTQSAPAPSSEKLQIIWLSSDHFMDFIRTAASDRSVVEYMTWLKRTKDWKPEHAIPFQFKFREIEDRGVFFVDTKTSAVIIYTHHHGEVVVLPAPDGPGQVFVMKDHQLQQVPAERLPSTVLNWSLLHHAQPASDIGVLQRDCCTACLTCLGANAVCLILFVCCVAGGIPCCPVGPGVCAAAIASCTGSLGCDCLNAC